MIVLASDVFNQSLASTFDLTLSIVLYIYIFAACSLKKRDTSNTFNLNVILFDVHCILCVDIVCLAWSLTHTHTHRLHTHIICVTHRRV